MKIAERLPQSSSWRIERLLNLSDAIIAIAITLLVLPLADRAAELHVDSFTTLINEFGRLLFISVLSFVVICRFWIVHHNIFNALERFNTKLFWLNAAWLLSIVLIPFTSELLVNSDDRNIVTTGIYIGMLLVTSATGVAMQWLTLHSPELCRSREPTSSLSSGIVAMITIVVALAIAIAWPSVGPWTLFLLVPSGYVSKYFRQ